MAAPSMKGIFDGGGKPPPSEEPPMDDEGAEGDYPPEYDSAYDEWETNPSKETMWRMIDACANGGGKGGGLAILLGKAKGKK